MLRIVKLETDGPKKSEGWLKLMTTLGLTT